MTPRYLSGNIAPNGHKVINSESASAGTPSGSVSVGLAGEKMLR